MRVSWGGELHMIVSQDLKRMLPDWYEGLYETDLLMTIEQSLIDDLATQINRAQSNLYISTADSETLAVYENMLRITRQNGDTLDMRRFRILTRLASQKPYTLRYLEELLSSFGDPVTVENKYNEYRIIINSYFEKQGQMSDLDYLVRTIIPANLITEISNHLRMNDLKERICLSASMTIGEMVVITQDFNKSKSIRGKASIAVGLSNVENQNVTADFIANNQVAINAAAAIGQTQAQFSDVTQDFRAVETTTIKSKNAAGIVSAEFIEINKESE